MADSPKLGRDSAPRVPAEGATAPAKKNPPAVLGVVVLLTLAGLVFWWASMVRGTTAAYDAPGGTRTGGGSVTYMVSSSCPVNVTYAVNGVDIQQEQGVPDGWTKTVPGSIGTMNAQLTCDGEVSVGIAGDAGPNKTAASKGEYAIAQVSYP